MLCMSQLPIMEGASPTRAERPLPLGLRGPDPGAPPALRPATTGARHETPGSSLAGEKLPEIVVAPGRGAWGTPLAGSLVWVLCVSQLPMMAGASSTRTEQPLPLGLRGSDPGAPLALEPTATALAVASACLALAMVVCIVRLWPHLVPARARPRPWALAWRGLVHAAWAVQVAGVPFLFACLAMWLSPQPTWVGVIRLAARVGGFSLWWAHLRDPMARWDLLESITAVASLYASAWRPELLLLVLTLAVALAYRFAHRASPGTGSTDTTAVAESVWCTEACLLAHNLVYREALFYAMEPQTSLGVFANATATVRAHYGPWVQAVVGQLTADISDHHETATTGHRFVSRLVPFIDNALSGLWEAGMARFRTAPLAATPNEWSVDTRTTTLSFRMPAVTPGAQGRALQPRSLYRSLRDVLAAGLPEVSDILESATPKGPPAPTGARLAVPPIAIGVYGTRGDWRPFEAYVAAFRRAGLEAALVTPVSLADGVSDLAGIERGDPSASLMSAAAFTREFSERSRGHIAMASGAYLEAGTQVTVVTPEPPQSSVGPMRLGEPTVDALNATLCFGKGPRLRMNDSRTSLPYPAPNGGWLARLAPNPMRSGTGLAPSSATHIRDPPAGVHTIVGRDHLTEFSHLERVYTHGGAGTVKTIIAAGAKFTVLSDVLDRNWLPDGHNFVVLGGSDSDVLCHLIRAHPRYAWAVLARCWAVDALLATSTLYRCVVWYGAAWVGSLYQVVRRASLAALAAKEECDAAFLSLTGGRVTAAPVGEETVVALGALAHLMWERNGLSPLWELAWCDNDAHALNLPGLACNVLRTETEAAFSRGHLMCSFSESVAHGLRLVHAKPRLNFYDLGAGPGIYHVGFECCGWRYDSSFACPRAFTRGRDLGDTVMNVGLHFTTGCICTRMRAQAPAEGPGLYGSTNNCITTCMRFVRRHSQGDDNLLPLALLHAYGLFATTGFALAVDIPAWALGLDPARVLDTARKCLAFAREPIERFADSELHERDIALRVLKYTTRLTRARHTLSGDEEGWFRSYLNYRTCPGCGAPCGDCTHEEGCVPEHWHWPHYRDDKLAAVLAATREEGTAILASDLKDWSRGMALFYNATVSVYDADEMGNSSTLLEEHSPPDPEDSLKLQVLRTEGSEFLDMVSPRWGNLSEMPPMPGWPLVDVTVAPTPFEFARPSAFEEWGWSTARRFALNYSTVFDGVRRLIYASYTPPEPPAGKQKPAWLPVARAGITHIRLGANGIAISDDPIVSGERSDAYKYAVAELNRYVPLGQPPLRNRLPKRTMPSRFADFRTLARSKRVRELFDVEMGVNWLDLATPENSLLSLARYTTPFADLAVSDTDIADIAQVMAAKTPYLYDALELARPQQILADWVYKYSCGMPFEGQLMSVAGATRGGRSRKDLVATGWLDAAISASRERLRTGVLGPGLHHAFVKSYVVTEAKAALGAQGMRTVVAQCPVDYLTDMAWSFNKHKRFVETWAYGPAKTGMPMCQAGFEVALRPVAKRSRVVCLDATAFDSNISVPVTKVLNKLDGIAFAKTVGSETAERWSEARYRLIAEGLIVNLVTGEGVEKTRGIATGCAGTTDKNSEALQASLIYAVSKASGRPIREFFEHSDLANTGDDSAWGTDLTEAQCPTDRVIQILMDDLALPMRLEYEGSSLFGATWLKKTIAPAEDYAADFRAAGLELPGFALVHDRASILTRQTAVTVKETALRLYERTLGHMLLCSHHPDIYDFLASEAQILRKELVSRGWAAAVRSRKIPSYKRVMELNYRAVPLPPHKLVRHTVWQEYCLGEELVLGTVTAVMGTLRDFGLRSMCGERLSAGTMDAFPSLTLRTARALAELQPKCLSLEDYRYRVAQSPYGPAIDTDTAWRAISERGTGMTAQEASSYLQLTAVANLATNYAVSQMTRAPIARILGTLYNFLIGQSTDVYGLLSIPYFLGAGEGSPLLTYLVPKDPYFLSKRVVLCILDHAPDDVLALGLPKEVFEGFRWLIDSLGPTVFLPNATDSAASTQGSGATDKWMTFVRGQVLPALVRDRTVLVTASTGTGKSRNLPACLLVGYKRAFVLQPRKILCATLSTATWVHRGTALPDRGVVTMTYGYAQARSQRSSFFAAGDVVLFDEVHDPAAEIVQMLLQVPTAVPVVYLTATAENLLKLGLRPAACHLHLGGSPPFEITKLSAPGLDPVRAVRELWAKYGEGKTLLIEPTKKGCVRLYELLASQGLNAGLLHSGIQVPDSKVIVATQVVDAGITIPGVRFVVDTGRRIVEHTGRLLCVPTDAATEDQRAGRTGRTCTGYYLNVGQRWDLPLVPYPTTVAYFQSRSVWKTLLGLRDDLLADPAAIEERHLPLNPACIAKRGLEETVAWALFALRYRTPEGCKRAILKEDLSEATLSLRDEYPGTLDRLLRDATLLDGFLADQPFLVSQAGRSRPLRWLRLLDGALGSAENETPMKTLVAGVPLAVGTLQPTSGPLALVAGCRSIGNDPQDHKTALQMFCYSAGIREVRSAILREATARLYKSAERRRDPLDSDGLIIAPHLSEFIDRLAIHTGTRLTGVVNGRVTIHNASGYLFAPLSVLGYGATTGVALGTMDDGRSLDEELSSRLLKWGNLLRVGSGVIVGGIESLAASEAAWQHRWPRVPDLVAETLLGYIASHVIVRTGAPEGRCLEEAFAWFNREDPKTAAENRALAGLDTTASFERFAARHGVEVRVTIEASDGSYSVMSHRPAGWNGCSASFYICGRHVEPMEATRLDLVELLSEPGRLRQWRANHKLQAPVEGRPPDAGVRDLPMDRRKLNNDQVATSEWRPLADLPRPETWGPRMQLKELLTHINAGAGGSVPPKPTAEKWQATADHHLATLLIIRPNGELWVTPRLGARCHSRASYGYGLTILAETGGTYRIGRHSGPRTPHVASTLRNATIARWASTGERSALVTQGPAERLRTGPTPPRPSQIYKNNRALALALSLCGMHPSDPRLEGVIPPGRLGSLLRRLEEAVSWEAAVASYAKGACTTDRMKVLDLTKVGWIMGVLGHEADRDAIERGTLALRKPG